MGHVGVLSCHAPPWPPCILSPSCLPLQVAEKLGRGLPVWGHKAPQDAGLPLAEGVG